MRFFKSIALFWVFVSTPVMAQEKAQDWQGLAIADVEAAYKETKENHPGMLDKTNPMFPTLLEKARTEALKLAKRTKDVGGFEASIGRFRAVIDDGHAGAYTEVPEKLSASPRWPGFVSAWRGDAMYVYKSNVAEIADGAKITSCDNVPIKKLIERNVFQYRTGRNTPGNWWSEARRAFVDVGNPFITLPKSCTFDAGGKVSTQTLKWSVLPENYQILKNGSANGEAVPIGMTERVPGFFWIGMQDYQPDDDGVTAYKKMFAEIKASREKLLKARAIVLDLRFNNGGSSKWSYSLAELLWGTARVDRLTEYHHRHVQIHWRPTAGNEKKLMEYRVQFEKQGLPDMVQYFDKMIGGFSLAKTAGKDFWIEPNDHNPQMPKPADNLASDPPALTTPVYVIVPGQCASACLDALDYFKLFPNTKLIGAPSSSDSTYMEVRSGPLPSEMGGVIIPMKIWVGRPRGNGVYYNPDIMMTDLDWSTANFQRKIEADMVKR